MEMSPSMFEASTVVSDTHESAASNGSSCGNSSECHNLEAVSAFLREYYIWLVFAFGFPGNLISFCVILNMFRQRLSTSLFYVALLAVVDNLAIILKILEMFLQNKALAMDPIRCKCLFFSGLTVVAYANWILIVMSAERYTAVCFPLKVGLIWSLQRAVGIVAMLFMFLCGVHVHLFVTADGNSTACWPKPEYLSFYEPWWFFISSTIFSFIPAICIITFNILIIRKLRQSSVKRRSLLSRADSVVRDLRQQERQVTIMLVTLALVFVVLTTPRCVYNIGWLPWQPTDPLGIARKSFLNAVTISVADSNHAINFYLYFVSITKFRNCFLDCFRCYNKPKKYVDIISGSTQLSDMSMKRLDRKERSLT